jgi:FO synthase subunit 1
MPKIIAYRKQVTVPLAHWCRNNCGYCGFYHQDNELLPKADIAASIKHSKAKGVHNVLFMSGECPDKNSVIKALLQSEGYSSFADYLFSLCRMSLRQGMVPALCVGYLSKAELRKFKGLISRVEISLENTSDRLNKPGLPHFDSPGKDPKVRLAMLRAAGELKIPVSTGLLVGIGETRRERYRTLEDIKDLHEKYGNIQETFIRAYSPVDDSGGPGKKVDLPLITDTVRYAGAIMPEMPLQVSINQLLPYYRELVATGVSDFGNFPLNGDLLMPHIKWPNMNKLARDMRGIDAQLVESPVVRDSFASDEWYSSDLLKVIRKLATMKMGSPSANG